ncbi:MAG: 50S ribosomal protein L6 [Bacteroidota bacterium]
MSRVAKKIVSTKGVEIKEENRVLSFKGSFGQMKIKLHEDILVNTDDSSKTVFVSGDKATMALKGTFIRLIENAIIGVTKGFEKNIKLNGVGYKAMLDGKRLKLNVGLSHEVFLDIPENINIKLPNVVNINITSCDKELLGLFADRLCKSKKYNVYNGTGILDSSKFYIKKETKKK